MSHEISEYIKDGNGKNVGYMIAFKQKEEGKQKLYIGVSLLHPCEGIFLTKEERESFDCLVRNEAESIVNKIYEKKGYGERAKSKLFVTSEKEMKSGGEDSKKQMVDFISDKVSLNVRKHLFKFSKKKARCLAISNGITNFDKEFYLDRIKFKKVTMQQKGFFKAKSSVYGHTEDGCCITVDIAVPLTHIIEKFFYRCLTYYKSPYETIKIPAWIPEEWMPKFKIHVK